MKVFTTLTLALVMTLATAVPALAGNGAPNGAHYNLNIIGVKAKTADMDGNTGGRIFVLLNGGDPVSAINGKEFSVISKVNKIMLSPGADFQVTDANATDADGAAFTLPATVSADYVVYARGLGKPGDAVYADMTTCATWDDPTTTVVEQIVICSLLTLHVERKAGGAPKFENVTDKLLFVTLSSTTGTTCTSTTVALFDDCLQNYFWNYDNHGLRLLQLRFYPKA